MIGSFSPRQMDLLTWWCDGSPWKERDGVICDGAVRSGKTLCMGLSFLCWAMRRFDGAQFAFCGKTCGSVRRNLLTPIQSLLESLGFQWQERKSENLLRLTFGGHTNTFYLFGGQDESSASLIQGATLAGVLLDEAALMPRSFVEQACARCSVDGAKLWFNCNPEGPEHWFYKEWIAQVEAKNTLYLHFTMEDNPALSPETLMRYRNLYSGAFYRRFVLGEWVTPQGLVYDFFHSGMLRYPPEGLEEFVISCDYGTRNPASFGLWGRKGQTWYRIREYYYDSRREKRQKTDVEYEEALRKLADGRKISLVVVDPSAASFLALLQQRGWKVARANNDVLSGIRLTARLLQEGKLVISPLCRDSIREFSLYRWDDRVSGQDQVVKEHDHAMDDIRYFAMTVAARPSGFFAGSSPERAAGFFGRRRQTR